MQRRIAGASIVAAGVLLISTVLVTDLFDRSNAFERLSARTRTSFTDQAIQRQRQDLANMQTIATSLGTALPALGQQANLTDAQLRQFLGQFPDFVQGMEQLPAIAQRMSALVDAVDAEQARFQSADAIPTDEQHTTNVPWFILLVGILSLIVGTLMATNRSGIWATAAVVLGIVIVAVPLATSLPQKSTDADRLNDVLAANVYTDATITGVQQAATVIGRTAASLQNEVLPAVAQRLDVTPQQIQDGLATFFPDLGTAIAETPAALERLNATATTLSATRSDFGVVAGTTYAPIAWVVVSSGIAVLLLGTWVAVNGAMREQRAERELAKRVAA